MDYTPPQDHFKHRRLYTHGRIPQGGSSDCSFICFNIAFLKRVTEYFEHPPHLFLKSHLLLPQCRVLNSAREPLLHYIDYPIPVHPHLLLTHPITTLQLHIFKMDILIMKLPCFKISVTSHYHYKMFKTHIPYRPCKSVPHLSPIHMLTFSSHWLQDPVYNTALFPSNTGHMKAGTLSIYLITVSLACSTMLIISTNKEWMNECTIT